MAQRKSKKAKSSHVSNDIVDNDELTPYERERLAKIKDNQAMLMSLGLNEAATDLSNSLNPPDAAKKRKKRSSGIPGVKKRAKEMNYQRRSSARVAAKASIENGEAPPPAPAYFALHPTKTQRGQGLKPPAPDVDIETLQLPWDCVVPTGVKVIKLGTFVTSPPEEAELYWSSPGCRYRHRYPVGYVSRFPQWNRIIEQTILKGPEGPVFQVYHVDPETGNRLGPIFSGPNPTRAWMAAAKRYNPKQSISGPRFFGFSDETLMKLLSKLERETLGKATPYDWFEDPDVPAAIAPGQGPNDDATTTTTTTTTTTNTTTSTATAATTANDPPTN